MRERLRLPPAVEEKVMHMAESSYGATLVTLKLRSGRSITNVVIAGGLFVSWIGDREYKEEAELGFALDDVVDAERQCGRV